VPDLATEQSLLINLVRDNWTDTRIAYQNKPFTPPEQTGDADSPARFIQQSIEYEDAVRLTFGGTELRTGVLKATVWIEENAGESGSRDLMDQLVDIVRAADLRSSGITLFPGIPSRLGWIPAPHGNWYVWGLDFIFWSTSDATQGYPALAGETTSRVTVTQAAHGFSVGDFIGHEFGGDVWSKAISTLAYMPTVSIIGVVSAVSDSDTFTVTLDDTVRIPAHGIPLGTVWLSTTVAGATQSTQPALGEVEKVVASVHDADLVTVFQVPWVER
jgi:hypothetical protein